MREQIRGLDGIRAVAVTVVLLHHTLVPLVHGGYLGVDLFFVLSGFLITTLLLREHASTGRVALGRFYARRALRLYPALVLTVVLFAPFARTISHEHLVSQYVAGAALSLTFTMDVAQVLGAHVALSHTWSLAIEEQFYLVWPVALLALLRRGRRAALTVALALAVVLAVVYGVLAQLPATRGAPISFNPLTRPSGLFLGCALALALGRGALVARPWQAAAGLGGVGVVLLAAQVWTADALQAVYLPAACLATALLILGLGRDGGVRRLLETAPLRWLGRRSYGLYLLHLPVFDVVSHHLAAPRGVQTVVQVLLSVGLCALSYRFVEQPFLRLKTRFEVPSAAGLPTRT